SDDCGSNLLGVFQGSHDIRANLLFKVAASNREDKNRVLLLELTHAQPIFKHSRPSFVIGAGSQFRNIIGGGIRFEAHNFPEIVYGMRSVRGAASHAENKKTSFAKTSLSQ